jgi:hypothetical protein
MPGIGTKRAKSLRDGMSAAGESDVANAASDATHAVSGSSAASGDSVSAHLMVVTKKATKAIAVGFLHPVGRRCIQEPHVVRGMVVRSLEQATHSLRMREGLKDVLLGPAQLRGA